ncbi:hypothetical protein GUITHDRAFT_42446, partial [Guillardia theta CCMP2712]
IGSGSFKLVYKASWKHTKGNNTAVAILRIPDSASSGKKEDFEQELKILIHLGNHPNLLRLYGITLEPASKDYCLVTAFAPEGSLDNVLMNLAEKNQEMSLLAQLCAASQICDGMLQLSLNGVVHRDLAARNVCIADYGLAMIAIRGYGQSRGETINTTNSTARPIRWMAPESIRRRQYSEKSDVWAFGVTMWEIWSYGELPFSTEVDDASVGSQVLQGKRLPQPPACPPVVYKIMKDCW